MTNNIEPNQSTEINLVMPEMLALRVAYLISTTKNDNEIFLKATRKRLEKLAEQKDPSAQTVNENNTITLNKAPITEAYMACVRYELEKLGFALISVDKQYLICVAEDLRKIRWTDNDNAEIYSLDESKQKTKVDTFITDKQKKTNKDNNSNKPITEDKLLVLKDIWVKLINHAKANIDQPEPPTLTYQALTNQLDYKVHRNGLASFLYSIENYCKENSLPKLNYLVVKEGTELPDNLESKHYGNFIGEIKKINEFIKSGKLPESPDINYIHKARPKKPS